MIMYFFLYTLLFKIICNRFGSSASAKCTGQKSTKQLINTEKYRFVIIYCFVIITVEMCNYWKVFFSRPYAQTVKGVGRGTKSFETLTNGWTDEGRLGDAKRSLPKPTRAVGSSFETEKKPFPERRSSLCLPWRFFIQFFSFFSSRSYLRRSACRPTKTASVSQEKPEIPTHPRGQETLDTDVPQGAEGIGRRKRQRCRGPL